MSTQTVKNPLFDLSDEKKLQVLDLLKDQVSFIVAAERVSSLLGITVSANDLQSLYTKVNFGFA